MSKAKNLDFLSMVAVARQKVRLLGVVPFDLNWEELVDRWAERGMDQPALRVEILCESDNLLFARSFTSDTEQSLPRRSFVELKFIRDRALELRELLRDDARVSLRLEIMHLPIPLTVLQIDDSIFIIPSLDDAEVPVDEIGSEHPWRDAASRYISSYFDGRQGSKYARPPGEELLELFDHGRIPRGIFPRYSFYDTDYSQLVVWALIFDRQGRMLIHRRKDNAKDNREMWDKSVGGHVDFSLDVDTSRAVLREMIEELFVDESSGGGGFRPLAVTDEDTIFLGEWRPERRARNPFREISRYRREWAYFRLRDSQHVYTPRLLPDGSTRRLRVIADVFVVVAGPALGDDLIERLKNSEYRLIELSELKSAMDSAIRGQPVSGFDRAREVPLFTPDLTNIMTGGLRDTLEEFAQYVKRYLD